MSQPNIILIITSQQRYDTIQALGYPHVHSPQLDRLVREGVSFEHCYSSAPATVPARASLFTGSYPHVSGILRAGDRWQRSWVERLRGTGYHCVAMGNMPASAPAGFHERYVLANKVRHADGQRFFDEWDKALRLRGLRRPQLEQYRERADYRERMGAFTWELPPELHADNFLGEFAQWWLRSAPRKEPLFLQIGFPGPHPPYDPTPAAASRSIDRDLPLPVVSAADIAGQPPPLRRLRQQHMNSDHDAVVHLQQPSRLQLQRLHAYYSANVSMIDQQVGAILAALDEQAYLENCVVAFSSDHGDCLGEHGQIQKRTMYDSVLRVPVVFWSPGRFQAGRRYRELCQWMDLGATLLELAGLPPSTPARSLLPALRGQSWRGRGLVFAEQAADGIYEGPYMTMVRSAGYKLVHFAGQEYGQLFDLEADPRELRNLWDTPALAQVKQEMLRALLDWRTQSALERRNLDAEQR